MAKQRNHPWELERLEVAHRTVGSPTDPLDDLKAALGRFTFYAIPVGRVKKLKDGKFHFRVTAYAFFIWDSFDFNDDAGAKSDLEDKIGGGAFFSQPLGCWHFGRSGDVSQLRAIPWTAGGVLSDRAYYWKPALMRVSGWHSVYNATYRAFRIAWKRGRDFLICSDVKVLSGLDVNFVA